MMQFAMIKCLPGDPGGDRLRLTRSGEHSRYGHEANKYRRCRLRFLISIQYIQINDWP